MKFKESILIVSLLSFCGLMGIYTDFFLSFKAYQINASYFIKHEANREIVGFFANGDFPIMFFFTVISFPIAIFLFISILHDYKNTKYKKEYLICLTMFVYCLSVTRMAAGMTWYLEIRSLLTFFQLASYFALGALGCLIYVMRKESKQNEIKNKSSV